MREREKSLILFMESMANDHKVFKYVVDSVDVSVFGSYLDGFHFSSQPNSLSSDSSDNLLTHTPTAGKNFSLS